MNVFTKEIYDWESWGQVYHDIEAFKPLINFILTDENIPLGTIEKLKPGTHGVLKIRDYVIKIFAPIESGYDSTKEFLAEIEGINIGERRNVLTSNIIKKGSIKDKYQFNYLIMAYIDGKTLGDIKSTLNSNQKKEIGKKLRDIVNKLNYQCDDMNQMNVIDRTLNSPKWAGAPKEILEVQEQLLKQISSTNKVYCHGDLTEDNIIITDQLDVYILDFADAVCAPFIYEYAPLIVDAFSFDKDFIEGFFGVMDIQELLSLTIHGLLIHEYGYQTIKTYFKNVTDIEKLREKIYLTFVHYKSIY